MKSNFFKLEDHFWLNTASGVIKKNMEVVCKDGQKGRVSGYGKKAGEIFLWLESPEGSMFTKTDDEIVDDLKEFIKILESL